MAPATMRLSNLAIATLLFGGTACLGSYTPSGSSSGQQTQPSSPSPPPSGNGGGGGNGNGTGGGHPPAPVDGGTSSVPTGSPPPAPTAPTAPTGLDGGTTSPTGPGATPNCQSLGDCCDLLDTTDAQTCNDSLTGLSDDVCAGILAQLEDQGVCP
jgi:hypothetical protein